MLHDERLLLVNAILECGIEESQQLLLLRHVEAGQHRDVVLALGAEDATCPSRLDELST